MSDCSQVLRCGKYKDVTECGVGTTRESRTSLYSDSAELTVLRVCLQVDFNSKNTVTAERQTFYCVPIPGESPWVKEIS